MSVLEEKPTLESVPTSPSLPRIKWAPLKVPARRRIQTFAVFLWTALLPISVSFFLLLCSLPFLWPLLIPYLIWIIWFDRAPDHGGRSSPRMRNNWITTAFAGYFPVTLIKTAELPPDRTYVIGSHPHGIISMGAVANFGTDSTGFSTLFPGLKPHLMTLSSNFYLPFYRDILLSMGICSVSMKSCSNILKQGPGSALTIVVGGAAESLSAHPGTNDLTLKRRMGFLKLAIRSGADLVPVFSFGENDIFEQLANKRGTRVYGLQKQFQAVFGFTIPLFSGRGIFNYNFGILPYRHPIFSVVGRPVRVEQCDNPTAAQVEDVQKRYIVELMRIWNDHKAEFAPHRLKELEIIA